MAFVTETYRPKLTLADRLSNLTASYRARATQRRLFRQTRNELRNLTSRELSDIGIHPSMIDSIARTAAYGEN